MNNAKWIENSLCIVLQSERLNVGRSSEFLFLLNLRHSRKYGGFHPKKILFLNLTKYQYLWYIINLTCCRSAKRALTHMCVCIMENFFAYVIRYIFFYQLLMRFDTLLLYQFLWISYIKKLFLFKFISFYLFFLVKRPASIVYILN